jgi:putative phage-type endonuclease
MLINQDFTEDRTSFIGGSDIGAILGVNPYRTALDVWLEKTGKSSSQTSNLAMRFGSFAEDFVANEYALSSGLYLRPATNSFIHPSIPYFCAHIDRLVFETPPSIELDQTPNKILECKTANPFRQADWGDAGTNQVPLSYLCQCAWYMSITNIDRTDLAVLFGNSDFRIYSIDRDKELENLILDKAHIFWNKYVLKDIAPPTTTEADCKKLFQKSNPKKTIEADKELLRLAREYQQLLLKIEEADDRINLIKQSIMNTMQDAQSICIGKHELISWKNTKPIARFDSSEFEKAHPDLYRAFQKVSDGSRRFVFKPLALENELIKNEVAQ